MRGAHAAALLIALWMHTSPARAQSVPAPGSDELNVADVVDRMNRAETALFQRLKTYHPLVEAYIQHLVPDQQLGWVPAKDDYFLGQFDFADRPRLRQLGQERKQTNRVSRWNPVNGGRLLPDGFAAMAAPDWKGLDRSRYQFTFVRREFLGEARTFVFDVRPLRGGDGFSGRIWIEARDYTLIRFNGINQGTNQMLSSFFNDKRLSFHMDGWRVNVMPGVWLPSYIYSEETDLSDATSPRAKGFRSQVRIWGYQAQAAVNAQQLTAIHINEAVVDETDASSQLSPVMSQRRWEQEAEANVIERLEKIGLLAPAGEVDRVLETVLNNLIVTSKLALERPLRCRVLLTSPLESFTIGHTIVLSRGLIDVLPDEASLATMLAHELAHVDLGHPLIDTKFAFADRLMVSDADLLQALQFHRTAREETAADERVIEVLKTSPYQDKLAGAGLFLKTIAQSAPQLPNLIQPHIGDHVADGGQIKRFASLIAEAPALAPTNLQQISALSLGARIIVEPWNDRLVLDKSPAVPLASIREKMPLAVTPLMPYIRYKEAVAPQASSR
jgi:peptidase M48-like protein